MAESKWMLQQQDPAQGRGGWPGQSSAGWERLDGASTAGNICLSPGLPQTSGLRHLPALFEVVLCARTERNWEFHGQRARDRVRERPSRERKASFVGSSIDRHRLSPSQSLFSIPSHSHSITQHRDPSPDSRAWLSHLLFPQNRSTRGAFPSQQHQSWLEWKRPQSPLLLSPIPSWGEEKAENDQGKGKSALSSLP